MKQPISWFDKESQLFHFDCPICRKQLAKCGDKKLSKQKMKKPNYCSNCGTRIDWSQDDNPHR